MVAGAGENGFIAQWGYSCGHKDDRIRRAESVMETLLTDSKVKAFLAEKIRELGLVEKMLA